MKTFNTIEELHAEWEINGACEEGKKFNHSCNSLQEIFEKCPLNFRVWRISRGYTQFAEHCPWDKLSGLDWLIILLDQPQYAELCSWDKFDGDDWTGLLLSQPQFAEICDWNKLDKYNWVLLLSNNPKFIKYYKSDLLSEKDWKFFIKHIPELKEIYTNLKKQIVMSKTQKKATSSKKSGGKEDSENLKDEIKGITILIHLNGGNIYQIVPNNNYILNMLYMSIAMRDYKIVGKDLSNFLDVIDNYKKDGEE